MIEFKNKNQIIYRSTSPIIPKPSYFKGSKTDPLKFMTVGNLVDQAAENYPTREAIVSIHQNQRITFSKLKHKVRYTVCRNKLQYSYTVVLTVTVKNVCT